MRHLHLGGPEENVVELTEVPLVEVGLHGLVHAAVERKLGARAAGAVLQTHEVGHIERADVRHGILVVLLHHVPDVGVGIQEKVRQHKGVHLLLVGVEIAAAVEENAFHSPLPVLLEALLHHIKHGIRGKIVVKVVHIVPDVDVVRHLLPVLQELEKSLRGRRILHRARIVDGRQEHSRIERKRMVRDGRCRGISRNEESVVRETRRQPFYEIQDRRHGVAGLVARRLAAPAHAHDAVIVGADSHTVRSRRAISILVLDELRRKVKELVGGEAELVGVGQAARPGQDFLVHVLVAEGKVSVTAQHAREIVSPDTPVHFQVVKGQEIGHVRVLVGGHVEVPVLEGERYQRITAAQEQRRKVVGDDALVLPARHLDELVGQPGKGALVLRGQVIPRRRVLEGIVPSHIGADVHRHLRARLVKDGCLRAVLEVFFEVVRHLGVQRASGHLGMDIIRLHGHFSPRDGPAGEGKENTGCYARKKSRQRHGQRTYYGK